MAAEGGGADVRAFLAEAGVVQYTDALVAAGFDSLPNVLALDELGLQDLKREGRRQHAARPLELPTRKSLSQRDDGRGASRLSSLVFAV